MAVGCEVRATQGYWTVATTQESKLKPPFTSTILTEGGFPTGSTAERFHTIALGCEVRATVGKASDHAKVQRAKRAPKRSF